MNKREKAGQKSALEGAAKRLAEDGTADYATIYSQLHRQEKAFTGRSIRVSVPTIAELVADLQARMDERYAEARPRLLDYGCGKGWQYLALRVHEAWGGILPHCYDIGVRGLSEPAPAQSFHGVICTDMLEHIAPDDIDGVLADIFSKLIPGGRAFAHFSIACRPAKKELPDGRNIHLTVKPPPFWVDRLKPFRRAGLTIDARFDLESDPVAVTVRMAD